MNTNQGTRSAIATPAINRGSLVKRVANNGNAVRRIPSPRLEIPVASRNRRKFEGKPTTRQQYPSLPCQRSDDFNPAVKPIHEIKRHQESASTSIDTHEHDLTPR